MSPRVRIPSHSLFILILILSSRLLNFLVINYLFIASLALPTHDSRRRHHAFSARVSKSPELCLHALRQWAPSSILLLLLPRYLNALRFAQTGAWRRPERTERGQGRANATIPLSIASERSIGCMYEAGATDGLGHPVLRWVFLVQVHGLKTDFTDVSRGELGVEVCGGLVRFDNWFKGRGDLLEGEGGPVYTFEEGVLFELGGVALGTKAVFRVSVQQLLDKR